jgi:light-regulated signal transduction histidine kinase (bacteriophytochrome)
VTDRLRAVYALSPHRTTAAQQPALQDFAFIASHDLQEPPRKVQAFGICSNLDTSRRSTRGPGLHRTHAAGCRTMRSMLDGLMAYSRVTTKIQPFTRVDLQQVAADVLSDLEVRLMQTGGRVELGELPVIEADPLQMRQLLQNLLGNALKFHQPGVPPVVRVWSEPATREQRSATGKKTITGR